MINDGMLGDIRIGKLQQTNYAVTWDVPKDHASVAISQYYQIYYKLNLLMN